MCVSRCASRCQVSFVGSQESWQVGPYTGRSIGKFVKRQVCGQVVRYTNRQAIMNVSWQGILPNEKIEKYYFDYMIQIYFTVIRLTQCLLKILSFSFQIYLLQIRTSDINQSSALFNANYIILISKYLVEYKKDHLPFLLV